MTLPTLFDCGCSHMKVELGLCDVYDTRGELRSDSFDAGRCTECGGLGELIYGDGGGPRGERTECGWTDECGRCGGSGWERVVGGPAVEPVDVPVTGAEFVDGPSVVLMGRRRQGRRRRRARGMTRPRWLVVLLVWFHETMGGEADGMALALRKRYACRCYTLGQEEGAWGTNDRDCPLHAESPVVGAITEPECPGPDCLMCNGEACDLCGAGCWSHRTDCEHDCLDRHQSPTPPDESTRSLPAALDATHARSS